MHIHILGICGTFMGSLALLAKSLGHKVSGCDANVYPPMSTQLQEQGIVLHEGYDPQQLDPAPDLVVIGNAMSRGNAAVEYVLNKGMPYVSGPQWLADHVLQGRWVLAVAGTHGKTTTSSMLAWILEYAGMSPGFLIGGIPQNFGLSARLGDTPFFVVEADEYDSAFFDKRSKFVHYRPRTLLMNNLEFDHADIFADLAAIQTQFHHLLRTVPGEGLVISPQDDDNLAQVLQRGCWSEQQQLRVDADQQDAAGVEWQALMQSPDGSRFAVFHQGELQGEVAWELTGRHNVSNGLGALIAARHVGVAASTAIAALAVFKSVKRRMELLAEINGVRIYDDFAHHPTAIETTLAGVYAQRGKAKSGNIIAVIEPRSNTMRLGVHQQSLSDSTRLADQVFWFQPESVDWDLRAAVEQPGRSEVYSTIDAIVAALQAGVTSGDQIIIMSNGGFAGIHQKIIAALSDDKQDTR